MMAIWQDAVRMSHKNHRISASKTLEFGIANLHLDVDFATVALLPNSRIDEFRMKIEEQILYAQDALDREQDVDPDFYLNYIHGLHECRTQLMEFDGYDPIEDADAIEMVAEEGLTSFVTAKSVERAISALRRKMDSPLAVLDVALRFNDSRESQLFVRSLASNFRDDLELHGVLLPRENKLRAEVRQIILDLRDAVRACASQ